MTHAYIHCVTLHNERIFIWGLFSVCLWTTCTVLCHVIFQDYLRLSVRPCWFPEQITPSVFFINNTCPGNYLTESMRLRPNPPPLPPPPPESDRSKLRRLSGCEIDNQMRDNDIYFFHFNLWNIASRNVYQVSEMEKLILPLLGTASYIHALL